jgi:acyl-CoA synthetase (AMP-forming)/AMP-acid ligase II
VLLVDDDGRPITEPNAPGELFAKSDSIVVGYHKAPEKYAEALRDGYMSVGDVAYVDDEGYYFICDRKSDLIISGGVNVYPAEIEAVLVAHPEIADAGVIGVPDREWGESVHAFIVVSGDPADDAISSFAREHLAGYKIPRGYTRLDEIPRSASGKILKRDLRDVHAGKAPSSSA